MMIFRNSARAFALCVFLTALALVAAACGGDAPDVADGETDATEEDQGDGQDSAAEEAEAGETAPAEDVEVEDLGSVTVIQAAPLFVFAPMYVAAAEEMWADEGLDVQVEIVESGSVANAAVVGGSAEVAGQGGVSFVQAVAEGFPLVATMSMVNGFTTDYILSNRIIEEDGLTEDSSFEEKVNAVVGRRLGSPGPGSVGNLSGIWLLSLAGASEDEAFHVNLGGVSYPEALEHGTIDAAIVSPPVGSLVEHAGTGEVVVSGAGGGFDHVIDAWSQELVFTTQEYAEENPEVLRAINRGLLRANELLVNDVERATDIMAEVFDSMDRDVIRDALVGLRDTFDHDGRFTDAHWESFNQWMLEAGMVDEPIDLVEGEHWTNEYLD